MERIASTSRSASASGSASGSSLVTSTVTTPTPSVNGTGIGNGKERATEGFAGLERRMDALNVEAGTAGPLNGTGGSASRGQEEDMAMLDHIYQRGFIGGEYADLQLHYRPDRQPLRVHSLIMALSPTLISLLQHPQSPQQPHDIFLSLNGYDEITDEALWISIGFLYSSRSLGMVTPANAPSILAASILLQMPRLAKYAAGLCRESIESIVSPQEVRFWIAYLEVAEASPNKGGQAYWAELRDRLMNRLMTTLPHSLHAFATTAPTTGQQSEAQIILQRIYSVLPFNLFKAVLESPILGEGEGNSLSDQTRFGLAKKCVVERKKLSAASPNPQEFEETVVLAFGGGTGDTSNVNIVRRPKQNRKLWKASG